MPLLLSSTGTPHFPALERLGTLNPTSAPKFPQDDEIEPVGGISHDRRTALLRRRSGSSQTRQERVRLLLRPSSDLSQWPPFTPRRTSLRGGLRAHPTFGCARRARRSHHFSNYWRAPQFGESSRAS